MAKRARPVAKLRSLAEVLLKGAPSLVLTGGAASGGSSGVEAATAVTLLNYAIGNVGRTVRFGANAALSRASRYADVLALTKAMAQGEIAVILVKDANPAFTLPARAVYFDSKNDIALLRVPRLRARPLATADPVPGEAVAILGYPENGPFDAVPGRLGETVTVLTQDAYGNGPVERDLTSLRGKVRSGNSGGPMVDGRGEVVTTVFAALRNSARPGGFGVPNEIVTGELARAGSSEVDTGACAG